jgi:acyl phosphate:glycerol-3-phosphate acyltransferase
MAGGQRPVIALASVAGLLIGSIPTADWLGRARGIDLRSAGTGNPGTRNAAAVGGPLLGAAVLVVELVKGAAAVGLGRWMAGDPAGAMAGVGALAGNIYNPWFGWRGGKGLAIAGGTLLAGWPALVPVLAVVLGVGVAAFRRSGPASLLAMAVWLTAGLMAWTGAAVLPTGWGSSRPGWLMAGAVGSVAIMAPKHLADTFRPAGRPVSPPGA